MTNLIIECPACGSGLIEHSPEDAQHYEWWEFACGAEVIRTESGKLSAESPCYEALPRALKKLNTATV
jgi:hypothetical protein